MCMLIITLYCRGLAGLYVLANYGKWNHYTWSGCVPQLVATDVASGNYVLTLSMVVHSNQSLGHSAMYMRKLYGYNGCAS